MFLWNEFLQHLQGDISKVVSLIPFLPASLRHVFLQYIHQGVITVLSLQSQSSLLTSLLSASLPLSLLPLYRQHGYIVFEQTMTRVICDNNTTFHNTITESKDGAENFLYGWLIKSILDILMNKIRSEFGQEDDLTENQGQIEIYCLIAGTIPLKDTKMLYYHVEMLLFAKNWIRPNIQVCVPFLCTQVKSPTIQDHTKIERVTGYLIDTVQLSVVVGTDSNRILTLYVHASFVVHLDSNSYIGTYTILVHRSMLSLPSKQMNNMKRLLKARTECFRSVFEILFSFCIDYPSQN